MKTSKVVEETTKNLNNGIVQFLGKYRGVLRITVLGKFRNSEKGTSRANDKKYEGLDLTISKDIEKRIWRMVGVSDHCIVIPNITLTGLYTGRTYKWMVTAYVKSRKEEAYDEEIADKVALEMVSVTEKPLNDSKLYFC